MTSWHKQKQQHELIRGHRTICRCEKGQHQGPCFKLQSLHLNSNKNQFLVNNHYYSTCSPLWPCLEQSSFSQNISEPGAWVLNIRIYGTYKAYQSAQRSETAGSTLAVISCSAGFRSFGVLTSLGHRLSGRKAMPLHQRVSNDPGGAKNLHWYRYRSIPSHARAYKLKGSTSNVGKERR